MRRASNFTNIIYYYFQNKAKTQQQNIQKKIANLKQVTALPYS